MTSLGVFDMLDDHDIKSLEERFDMRYKLLKDCNDDMDRAAREHHALDTRLSVIENQQKFNNWLTALIAAGIIALVIKVFLGG